MINMNNAPTKKNYNLDTNCRLCEQLKLIYELDDRQYYFGCTSQLTCNKIKEKEFR